MASQCISKPALSQPPSASLSVLDLGLQVNLQTRSITASKCMCEFTRSRPRSASPNWHDYGLPVHLWADSIPVSYCISKLARSWPQSVSLRSLDRHLQGHLKLLSITGCCQSRYTVCREVAIFIHTYIDVNTNYDFQAHQQHSQRRCFSQTALQWFNVFPGAPRCTWRPLHQSSKLVLVTWATGSM